MFLKLCLLHIVVVLSIAAINDGRNIDNFEEVTERARKRPTSPARPTHPISPTSPSTAAATIEALTTDASTTILPTTEAVPPKPECPEGKSLHSEQDIVTIIDYIMDKENVMAELETTLVDARFINDELLAELNSFLSWITEKPKNLNNLLQNLAQKRKTLLEMTKNMNTHINNTYPAIEQAFLATDEKVKVVILRLSKYKKICEIYCEEDNINTVSFTLREQKEDLYCSSIQDLYENIQNKLKLFVKEHNESYRLKLQHDEKQLQNETQELRIKLKNKALKEFGFPMYEVLNLQDNYDNIDKELRTINLPKSQEIIDETLYKIEFKTKEMSRYTEKYGEKCNSCNKYLFKLPEPKITDFSDSNNSAEKAKDLLEKVFQKKMIEVDTKINDSYNNIFSELKSALNSTDLLNSDYTTIKAELSEIIYRENQQFRVVNESVPRATFDKIKIIEKSSENMLKSIEEAIEILKNLLNI